MSELRELFSELNTLRTENAALRAVLREYVRHYAVSKEGWRVKHHLYRTRINLEDRARTLLGEK
jgi:hypothetical protein